MKEQYGVYVGDYVTVGHNAILHGCTIGSPLPHRHGLHHS
jgi:carbonic anhydrase/acetyltransferase-like protein (isoleucine patch superfamily)